ncbi:hypothetical protein EON77_04450 [bacterium]|nr:MAG: hypothetical protein EON77_04450 [bacterium]
MSDAEYHPMSHEDEDRLAAELRALLGELRSHVREDHVEQIEEYIDQEVVPALNLLWWSVSLRGRSITIEQFTKLNEIGMQIDPRVAENSRESYRIEVE